MKILMCCPDWFPFSAGLAQSCYELCKQFEKQGHQVKILVAKDQGLEEKGLEVIALPYITRLLGRNPLFFHLYQKIKDYLSWADVVCVFSYMYLMNSSIVSLRKKGKYSKPL